MAQRRLAQVTLGEDYPYPVIDPEKLNDAAETSRTKVRGPDERTIKVSQ